MKVLVIQANPEEYLSRGYVRKDLSSYDAVLIAREGVALADLDDATRIHTQEPGKEAR